MSQDATPTYAPHDCGSAQRLQVLHALAHAPHGLQAWQLEARLHLPPSVALQVLRALHEDDRITPLDGTGPTQTWATTWRATQIKRSRLLADPCLITTPVPAPIE